MKLSAVDVVFWIIIAALIAVALWYLKGSPTLVGALISIALFTATSEILLWKKIYELDKKSAIRYVKTKNDLDKIKDLLKKK